MCLFCKHFFTFLVGVFEIEEWLNIKRQISSSVSVWESNDLFHSRLRLLFHVMHGMGGGGGGGDCKAIPFTVWLRMSLLSSNYSCLDFQVQWEWQESASTWRPYGRLENKVIEVRFGLHQWSQSRELVGM